jgi:hypothetical protein
MGGMGMGGMGMGGTGMDGIDPGGAERSTCLRTLGVVLGADRQRRSLCV